MNTKAVLLTIKDIVTVVIAFAVSVAVALGVVYALLVAPVWASQLFNFTIPDETPAAIVYGCEFMIIVVLTLAILSIRHIYLTHKENLEGPENCEGACKEI